LRAASGEVLPWLPIDGEYQPHASEHDLDCSDDLHVLRLVRWRAELEVPEVLGRCCGFV
jgi:hypothetical protein